MFGTLTLGCVALSSPAFVRVTITEQTAAAPEVHTRTLFAKIDFKANESCR